MKKLVTFRLSPKTIKILEKVATEQGTTKTFIIEKLLENLDYLSERLKELERENEKLRKEKEELLEENQKLLKELVARRTPWWKKLLK